MIIKDLNVEELVTAAGISCKSCIYCGGVTGEFKSCACNHSEYPRVTVPENWCGNWRGVKEDVRGQDRHVVGFCDAIEEVM